jgi:hypothetical protein
MVTYDRSTLGLVVITVVITIAAFGLVLATLGIQLAAAQELDKDRGASSLAPRADPDGTAGGWQPMEAPGREPDLAAKNNPGQLALKAEAIGCYSKQCPDQANPG